MTIREKLMTIQKSLKAPKNQYNNFGKYNYRSCEDILEALKPLLVDCVLHIHDEIIMVGDRYYVKSIAMLQDADGTIESTAYAREEQDKKGMDGAQITGAASSYARKYALNGLFLIDDTKDPDTQDNAQKSTQVGKLGVPENPSNPPPSTKAQKVVLQGLMKGKGLDKDGMKDFYNFVMQSDTESQAQRFIEQFDDAYTAYLAAKEKN